MTGSVIFRRMRRSRIRECLGVAALAIFFARALIPAGFMPVAGGGFPLAICQGVAPAWVDPGNSSRPANGGHHGVSLCAFAAAPADLAPPGLALYLPADRAAIRLVGLDFSSQRAIPAGPLRAQSSRAPPAVS